MKKLIIIYRPNGTEACFTTSKEVSEGGVEYALVQEIRVSGPEVTIVYTAAQIETYYRMPYSLERWD